MTENKMSQNQRLRNVLLERVTYEAPPDNNHKVVRLHGTTESLPVSGPPTCESGISEFRA